MLEYLAAHPRSVWGIVDTQTGLIYRSSQHAWRRALSFLLIAITTGVGALVFGLVLPSASWIPGFPAIDGAPLLSAYAYALAGSAVHLGIDAIKRIRSSQNSPDLAIDSWIIWVHVREIYVCAGIVLVAIAAFGVIATVHRTDPLTMFLAGYSWDSLQEVFIPRFVKTVSTRTSDLLTQVSN